MFLYIALVSYTHVLSHASLLKNPNSFSPFVPSILDLTVVYSENATSTSKISNTRLSLGKSNSEIFQSQSCLVVDSAVWINDVIAEYIFS
jgi:hypothetical protein